LLLLHISMEQHPASASRVRSSFIRERNRSEVAAKMTTEAREPSVFERIVCGVDGTPASLVAVRQALRLQDEEGSVLLLAVANLAQAAHAGMAATHAADLLQHDAQAALAEAQVIAHSANSKLVNGDPIRVLLEQAEHASLIAAGSHGRGRTSGLLLGTVAARVLRDATCSVLIARPARDIEAWPKTVVAGVDGSLESAAAFTVASLVAARFGGNLRAVASTKDQFDRETARAIAPELEEQGDRALDALVAASESADLIVVGNRGLHGLKALGSVSERVAHQASSSVLVVRTEQT
jgi:nucleotide-binding universal stress UspA family protein